MAMLISADKKITLTKRLNLKTWLIGENLDDLEYAADFLDITS